MRIKPCSDGFDRVRVAFDRPRALPAAVGNGEADAVLSENAIRSGFPS
jgi:hypothetical protein